MRFHSSLLILAATLSTVLLDGCDRQSQAPSQSQTPTSAGSASFGDFQFDVPAGWSRVQPDRKKTAAMLLLNGTASNNADGLLRVDVGKPVMPTARQTGQSFAGSDGKVLDGTFVVDGQDGVRVETASMDMSKPRHVVVVYRDGKVYLIMAAGTKGTDLSDAFDHVIHTWHWTSSP